MKDLLWLKSRRADAYRELKAAIVLLGSAAEVSRLQRLVDSFDRLIEHYGRVNYEQEKEQKRQRERLRRLRARTVNEERRRLGLVREEFADAEALPPPSLPVPVQEVEHIAEEADHVIAEDVARRANIMICFSYSCLSRRRSRRYEGRK